jgi:ribosomal protein L29
LRQEIRATREEMAAMRGESRQEIATTRDDLRQEMAAMRQENVAAHVETRRHFEVALEANRQLIQLVAEGVAHLDEKLERKTTAINESSTEQLPKRRP